MQRRQFLTQFVKGGATVAAQSLFSNKLLAFETSPRAIWHIEDQTGRLASAFEPDYPANPASLTKMATSLLALQRYSPAFRYRTVAAPMGPIDVKSRTLRGDLHLFASADPDFHFENAVLLANGLNRLGISHVTGNLVLHGAFHMDWDHGQVPLTPDQWRTHNTKKAQILRSAWDKQAWHPARVRLWEKTRARLSIFHGEQSLTNFQGVKIQGGIQLGVTAPAPRLSLAVTHFSNPLLRTLKRFNCHSNNDIERIGQQLGGAPALQNFLIGQLRLPAKEVYFSSTSGLETNRLSPRGAVLVLRHLLNEGRRHKLQLCDILPVAGLDHSTLRRRFTEPGYAGSVVAKTGTLVDTDGGVQTLCGVCYTRKGPYLFAMFQLQTGHKSDVARRQIDHSLRSFIDRNGGPVALGYIPSSFPLSYDQARIEVLS
jgi:D-alanyl-D-alanine carboxypeptidase/D-alanyl-D-alanine-endopeptidase (penicillin-binding protein 4)